MRVKDAVLTALHRPEDRDVKQLWTRWGEQVQKDAHTDTYVPFPEYPRPQMKREQYEILNGWWQYAIKDTWEKPETWDGRILVPFSPETALSGVERQLRPEEYLWYRREIFVTERPEKKRLLLHFGAVDQCCALWVNGKAVLRHVGGYLPFTADITDAVREGNNEICLRVQDYSDTSYHSRGKQTLNRGGMFYTAQSGIWQTVWSEWVPETYISSLRLTPLYDGGKLEIAAETESVGAESLAVRARVYDRGRLISEIEGAAGSALQAEIPDVKSWSPEDPFLYDLEIEYGEDRVRSYFAMRCITVEKDCKGVPRLCLNHQPYFQKGLLDQGYWPEGLYTPPCEQAFVWELEQVKALGFNMLRKHLKIEPLRWYYHCDRLGILVWQDMVNGGGKYSRLATCYLVTVLPPLARLLPDRLYGLLARKDAAGRREWMRECRETVKYLCSSPCIAAWVPFNEGWGQFDAGRAVREIRKLDRTRLIDEASGWYDQGHGDLRSIHNYFYRLKVPKDRRPVALTEYGGYVCFLEEHAFAPKAYGYRTCRGTEEFREAYEKLEETVEALKPHGLCASVYTQLSDVEEEVNGLFTYDRKVCKISQG